MTRNGFHRRGMPTLTVDFDGGISITKKLSGLHRETDRNLGAAVEHLKDLVTNQTAKLAFDALFGNQFDTAIAGVAFGTGEIRLFHARYRTMFAKELHPAEKQRSPPYGPSSPIWASPRPIGGEVSESEFAVAISERTATTLAEQFAVISRRRRHTL